MHNITLKIELDGKPVTIIATAVLDQNPLTSSMQALSEETRFDKASKFEANVLRVLERTFANLNLQKVATMIASAVSNDVHSVHRRDAGVFDG